MTRINVKEDPTHFFYCDRANALCSVTSFECLKKREKL